MAKKRRKGRAFKIAKADKLDPEAIAIKQRRAKSLQLRLAGASYRDIAQANGTGHSIAHDDVRKALEEVEGLLYEQAEAVRTMELARLDKIFLAVYQNAIRGDCEAARTVLKIMERRSKLLGLDKPTRVDIKHDMKTTIDVAVDDLSDDELAIFAGIFDRIDEAKDKVIDAKFTS